MKHRPDHNATNLQMHPRYSVVQFPRFQREESPDVLSSRNIVSLARQHAWLSPLIMSTICDPLAPGAPMRRDQKKETRWWGQWHYAQDKSLPSLELPDPENGRVSTFAGTLIRHDFEWDPQSVPGSREEIVLSRLEDNGDAVEVAAMLADTGHQYVPIDGCGKGAGPARRTARTQQLVIATSENPEWHEPAEGHERQLAGAYVLYMAMLANKPPEPGV